MKAETVADIIFVLMTLSAVVGWAVTANASAPGERYQSSVKIEAPGPSETVRFSPAEIRNAAIVRADRLEEAGVAVDRSVTYGIGLEP